MSRIFQYERRRLFPTPEAMFTVFRTINHAKEPRHRHDFIELVVVLAGTALHQVGRHQYRLEAGDVFVIHSPLTHGYEEPDGFHIVNILIRDDFFDQVNPAITALPDYELLFRPKSKRQAQRDGFGNRTHLEGEHFEQAQEWISLMEKEGRTGAPGGEVMAEAALFLLIGLVCRAGVPRALQRGPAPSRIGRLLSWMEARLEMPIAVADMARVAGMSERTLMRRFPEVTGMTPLTYLTELRLNRARALLSSQAQLLSHDEIAARCGMENGNYLARRFKQRFGVSPRAWRKGDAPGH